RERFHHGGKDRSVIWSLGRDPTARRNSSRSLTEIPTQDLLQMCCDLLSVESAVLNKNFVCSRSGDDHSSDVDSRNIAFQCYGIAHRAALLRRKLNAHRA